MHGPNLSVLLCCVYLAAMLAVYHGYAGGGDMDTVLVSMGTDKLH